MEGAVAETWARTTAAPLAHAPAQTGRQRVQPPPCRPGHGANPVTPGRCELLRALGAVADNPADARAACRALGVPELDSHQHTELFVLNCPPYPSVHLGPDGALGGGGADRFWCVMGISPPAEPDHLSSLLSLYASLGQAAAHSTRPVTAAALARAQAALLSKHLRPWLPTYLDAALDLEVPPITA